MYISGTVNDYLLRLHQLGVDSGVLYSFLIEGLGYYYLADSNFQTKMNQEMQKRNFVIDLDGISLTNDYFSKSYLYDANGNVILDVNGNPMISII